MKSDKSRFSKLMRFSSVVGLVIVLAGAGLQAADTDGVRFFREKIEPVLKSECFACHSRAAAELKGGLSLESRGAVLRGGESGPAVMIGMGPQSPLIQAIRHEGGLAMPPKKPRLSDATIADFVKWVEMGLPDPREETVVVGDAAGLNESRRHWSFQPVKKPSPPMPHEAAWVKTPIDAFIAAKREERHWPAAPAASNVELIRRVTFDLTGLPPTPAEIDVFLNDALPDAYERLVDRLLSSKHFGERAAQHWLDVVRYAETEGYEYDQHVPDAWRYRDYVIDSFNNDKPFDRFVSEQIAGDELDPRNNDCLTATIFHRLGPVRRNAGNPEIALSRNEVLTERTDILGAAFLGLTVGCARCHNHKLEPISQKDYYRLQAYLAATAEQNIVMATDEEKKSLEADLKKFKDEIAEVQKQAAAATGAEKERLLEQVEHLQDRVPPHLPTIPSTRNDFAKRTAVHVLRRGVWENKGEPVGPRPLSVLVSDEMSELPADEAAPRTQLARWLTSPDHPLTARVIVNRLWQQHFGVGLVTTANDFGLKGERPSHPGLLDWLAASLMENGWRLKPLHRVMVLSNTYQQSSRSSNAAATLSEKREGEAPAEPRTAQHGSAGASPSRNPASRIAAETQRDDPENRLLTRFNRRRLSAEEARDAMLAVSGRINVASGGLSVMVPVDPEMIQLLYKPSQWKVTPSVSEHDRRSIYLIAKRNLRLPFFENLDAPTLQASCSRRESSTHAPQSLELLNGALANDLARSFALRLERESAGDSRRIVELAFRAALGRSPTTDEEKRSLLFLKEQPLSEFALAMFNLNGFLYVQ
ncbi:MAG: PSD1 and planctomycete cytochrome C domain-containing protein [Planctomycetia bacterium]|nr:PSD1 and planctomycete cytochrome C domain-containing protein [Planctomycetia bacterium]